MTMGAGYSKRVATAWPSPPVMSLTKPSRKAWISFSPGFARARGADRGRVAVRRVLDRRGVAGRWPRRALRRVEEDERVEVRRASVVRAMACATPRHADVRRPRQAP